jgi:hypothetical protein
MKDVMEKIKHEFTKYFGKVQDTVWFCA